MGTVLRATQTHFDQHESSLHEHDKETSDQNPNHVNGKHVMGRPVIQFLWGHFFRIAVSDRPSRRGDPIACCASAGIRPDWSSRVRVGTRKIGWQCGRRRCYLCYGRRVCGWCLSRCWLCSRILGQKKLVVLEKEAETCDHQERRPEPIPQSVHHRFSPCFQT